jgi:hypothetical protein
MKSSIVTGARIPVLDHVIFYLQAELLERPNYNQEVSW